MLRKYADTKVEEYVCVKHDLTYLYLYGGFSGHDYLINSWVTKVNMINSLWSSEARPHIWFFEILPGWIRSM